MPEPASHAEPAARPTPRPVEVWGRRALWLLAYLAVTYLACDLIWPAPAGEMPLSADHPVHLARAWLYLEQLGRGHLFGWTPFWYFGFPLGEFYPPLGDLLFALIYSVGGVGRGLLDHSQAYALTFTAAYVGHALATVRAAQLVGVGPIAAGLAGALLLVDPGAVREGGWIFTAKYAVWFQPLACSLAWWGLASLSAALDHGRRATLELRRLVPAALLLGAALLTHPIALPMIAAGLPLLAVFLGVRSRLGIGRALVGGGVVGALALALAAWWVAPLLAHRHWMMSYGQLYISLERGLERLADGQWSSNMVVAVGVLIGLGLVRALAVGERGVRFFAAFALLLYLGAYADVFFALRLDWLAEGFLSIQYQRFITCAKPALFIAAGLGLTLPWALFDRRWWPRFDGARRYVGRPLGLLACLVLADEVVTQHRVEMVRHSVGDLRFDRRDDPEFDADLRRFAVWARKRWEAREGFYRLALRAPRHDHSLVDTIVTTHTPSYKLGFTPGETFVHKPEQGGGELLRRLRVRYAMSTGEWASVVAPEVVRFGDIKVWDYAYDRHNGVAELSGEGGEVEVLQEDYDAGLIQVRVRGAAPGSRLTFNVAGYPRWQLFHGDREIAWVEVPAVGNGRAATQEDRRSGRLREGRPGAPSGSEPLLIAAEGARDGVYTLRYRYWEGADVLGLVVGLLALMLLGLGVHPRSRAGVDRLLERVAAIFRPRVVVVLAVLGALVLGARYYLGYRRESASAVGWFYRRAVADAGGARPEMIKVARIIRPAVLLRPDDDGGQAWVTFTGVDPGRSIGGRRPPIVGWYATSDETLGRGKSSSRGFVLTAAIRPTGSDGPFSPVVTTRPQKTWGERLLEIPTDSIADGPVDVVVMLRAPKRTPAPYVVGFNLELGAPAGD
ncbi:MAG: hypothetical protein R3A79_25710 [Nannocystaceae bacterium]